MTILLSHPVSYLSYISSAFSFYSGDLPDWYNKTKEPKSQPGQSKGLKLVLDSHSDLISPGTIFDDFKGFVTVVGDKSSFPLTKRTSFLLKPGQENYVSLSAINVISGIIHKPRGQIFGYF